MMTDIKRNAMSKLLIQLVLCISFIISTTLTIADEITIVADEWAPYNGDPNSKELGYGIDIAKHVYEAAGHKVIYKILPWNRAIKEAREGNFNAIIGALREDAPDFIFPEEEFGVSENAFFVRKGVSWKFSGVESLQAVKIGLIKDYSYGVALDKFFKGNKKIAKYVYGTDPLAKNINKLLANRLDVLIDDPNVVLQKAMKMGVSDQIVKAESEKDTEDNRIYIAFSPKNMKSKEYAEILSKGIRRLKASGELEAILAKYGLEYWK